MPGRQRPCDGDRLIRRVPVDQDDLVESRGEAAEHGGRLRASFFAGMTTLTVGSG